MNILTLINKIKIIKNTNIKKKILNFKDLNNMLKNKSKN